MSDATELREQAARCRRLAEAIGDPQASQALRQLAEEYDDQARQSPSPRKDQRH